MTYNLSAKESTPRHPKDRSGVCLVVGTHPEWEKDYEDALDLARRSAMKIEGVCAVNDATALVNADYLATCHPENIDQFLHNAGKDIEIHTRKKLKKYEDRENQYVWGLSYGGGSALFAAASMLAIGHDMVILCGCPMNGKDGYAVKFHDDECPRLGDDDCSDGTIEGYQQNMQRFKDECTHAHKIRSMSGVTQQIFGGLQ